MALSVSMLCLSCLSVVLATAFGAKARIGKVRIRIYWVVPFVCAIVLVATGRSLSDSLRNSSSAIRT